MTFLLSAPSIQAVLLVLTVCTCVVYLTLQKPQPRCPTLHNNTETTAPRWDDTLNAQNEVVIALSKLIQLDGAGTWPPRTDHVNWPPALVPYRDTYFEMAPLLSATRASLDDYQNRHVIERFRAKMRKLLEQRIDLEEVNNILIAAERGDPGSLPRSCYNAFYNCVAVCRHMYRYNILPLQHRVSLTYSPSDGQPYL